ncbi:MAG: ribosome recycling factor [Acidobacteriota bacterium]|nr:ribosome recycling factor [Acidobacteriota bacterium]MDW3228220.1 ribosome recycling factor [Acidobacteriota bacterium]MDY0231795.1 ribosome recycling factor [Candidatus Saccharicenans sp.]
MVKDALRELEKKMKTSIEHFRKEISKLRTGRANISIFEDIKVMYYGTLTPVNQVATIGVPDPTLITVQPWDPTLMEAVEKAIRSSDFGFNPINDGRVIKVPIPPLDEERRQELAKKVSKMLEEEKTTLRNIRRESKEYIEELEKDKKISEDEKFQGLEKLQELLDLYIKQAEEIAAAKEKEILQA